MPTETTLAPICLFTYNRLWHTQQTIDALKKNDLAKDSDLIVFSDGPKNKDDRDAVKELRDYLKTISGFKCVTVIEQGSNLGLANSIIKGVTEVLSRYPKVIVVEDDLVTSTKFLTFMNDALNYYGNNPNVASIHAYTYPFKNPEKNDFFIRGADCWGWATWREQWMMLETDGSRLLTELENRQRTAEFDFNDAVHYTSMLKDQISGINNSWAIRWKASCFLLDKLTLYPAKSFVQNIGFDNSGMHCDASDVFWHQSLNEDYSGLNPVPVAHSREGFEKMSRFYKSLQPGFMQKLKQKIKSAVSQCFKS